MRSALFLSLIGALLALLGVVERGWFLLPCWFGLSFLWLGISHALGKHNPFQKRADGTIPRWTVALHLPFFCYMNAVWHGLRILSKEPAQSQVAEQLVVGRRLLESEITGEFVNYVDLTCEFSESSKARKMAGYVCFPILDAGAPSPERLKAAVRSLPPGRTCVHCAQGHGRTGLFALAFLLINGLTNTVEDGLRMLRHVRPGIDLNAQQKRCIELLARS